MLRTVSLCFRAFQICYKANVASPLLTLEAIPFITLLFRHFTIVCASERRNKI